jgi:hypothetical protein
LFAFVLEGCGKKSLSPSLGNSEPPIVKVSVFADGRLTLDGAPSTVQNLRDALRRLSEQHGIVWYYREAGQQEPPPIAKEVMQAVIDAKLPIRMSSRPDYSDTIGPGGKPTK